MNRDNREKGQSAVCEAVLALTANALFDAGRTVPAGIDWRKVYEESCQQTVQVLAFRAAGEAGAPQECLEEWRKKTVASVCSSLRVSWQHNELDRMMREAGIPYVVLKGCASALYYPDPSERIMGDVDFLVRKEDMGRAGSVLEQAGFVPWEEEHICHVVYRRPPEHYEMHFEPAGVPYGRAGVLVRDALRDVMEEARDVEYENGMLSCPSPFHHGLILLLHTVHHFLGEGIGLRHLCDWAVFAASLSEEEFREIFEEKLRAIGLWRFAQILTQTAEHCLGCPHREWTGAPEPELADAMIGEIFAGGNFGRKEKDRTYESYLISNRGKGGVGRTSMLRQMIFSLNEIVRTKWPKAKKMRVLLPAGWVYFGVKYLLKVAAGTRPPLHPVRIISGAAQRKDVYKEFRLFEN